MAVQRILKQFQAGLAAPLMPLLPSLLLVPVLVRLVLDVHAGGLNLVLQFWQAALQPSLDPVLLRSLLDAVATTLLSLIHI